MNKIVNNLIVIIFLIFVFSIQGCTKFKAEKVKSLNESSLYNLDKTWRNQEGESIQLKKLKGHPVVVAMAYTSCKHSCPMIVERMKKINSNLSSKNKEKVWFVLVSFDTKRDVPEKLKTFSEEHKINSTRWTLLNGDPESVREVAAVLNINYVQEENNEFSHSNKISLLDEEGVLIDQVDGLSSSLDEISEKLNNLLH